VSKTTPVGGQQGTALPYTEPPFRGKIERFVKDSVPDFPKAVEVRFSLDETFDIGADTGTPVVEDYADKIPRGVGCSLSDASAHKLNVLNGGSGGRQK
jgi:hypothetical protein